MYLLDLDGINQPVLEGMHVWVTSSISTSGVECRLCCFLQHHAVGAASRLIWSKQEEYIKDEMKNLKRELIRAKEEIKRIQSVPLVIGQFNEIIDANYGIVGKSSCCLVRLWHSKAAKLSQGLARRVRCGCSSNPDVGDPGKEAAKAFCLEVFHRGRVRCLG